MAKKIPNLTSVTKRKKSLVEWQISKNIINSMTKKSIFPMINYRTKMNLREFTLLLKIKIGRLISFIKSLAAKISRNIPSKLVTELQNSCKEQNLLAAVPYVLVVFKPIEFYILFLTSECYIYIIYILETREKLWKG